MQIPSFVLLALASVLSASPSSAQRNAAPPPATQTQIDAAIDKGAEFLLDLYADQFKANRLENLERVGQSALSLYTLIHAGVAHDNPTLRQLLTHVLHQPIEHTYDASCVLLALHASDGLLHRRSIGELAKQLIEWQTTPGDWSYPAGGPDLSNTQYAALGLWAAAADGVPIDDDVWNRLASSVLRYQTEDGGFSYSSEGGRTSNGSATGSMTAAGVATLAICETQLRLSANCSTERANEFATARARGMEWFQKNYSVSTNPKAGAWHYYYLYGLERMGALTGIALFGEHDWYAEGAALLVHAQDKRGCWLGASDLADTCFAILFLKRATATRKGPDTGAAIATEKIEGALRIASAGAGPVRLWIDSWNKQLTRELEWVDERGLGPHVVRVEYEADDQLVGVQLGDGARAAGYEGYGARVLFPRVGKYRVVARAWIRRPNAADEPLTSLESEVLEVEVTRAPPSWISELDLEDGPNLVRGTKRSARSSSQVKPKEAPFGLQYSANAAQDGNAATSWLAASNDKKPSWTLTFNKAVECDLIRISPAVLPAFGSDYLARPIELEIQLNGKNAQRLALDPNPLRPMRFELDETTNVKRIEITILSTAASASSELVGIGEVELFKRTGLR